MGLASFLGSVGSDIGGSLGDMAFNAWSADKQEDFQAKMASTQYQRAAADLEKAGLNRVLALGSPAAAPAGALAPPVGMGSAVAANRQAATSAKVAEAQVDNLHAGAENQRSQAKLNEQARVTSETQSILNSALAAWHSAQTGQLPLVGREIESRIALQGKQALQTGELARKTGAEADQAVVMKAVFSLAEPVIKSIVEKFSSSASSAASVSNSFEDPNWLMRLFGFRSQAEKDEYEAARKRYFEKYPGGK